MNDQLFKASHLIPRLAWSRCPWSESTPPECSSTRPFVPPSRLNSSPRGAVIDSRASGKRLVCPRSAMSLAKSIAWSISSEKVGLLRSMRHCTRSSTSPSAPGTRCLLLSVALSHKPRASSPQLQVPRALKLVEIRRDGVAVYKGARSGAKRVSVTDERRRAGTSEPGDRST